MIMDINKTRRNDPLRRVNHLLTNGVLQITDCGNPTIQYANIRALPRNPRTIDHIATENQ
jgi:hypothetical protein